jgi:hypothetical protein
MPRVTRCCWALTQQLLLNLRSRFASAAWRRSTVVLLANTGETQQATGYRTAIMVEHLAHKSRQHGERQLRAMAVYLPTTKMLTATLR